MNKKQLVKYISPRIGILLADFNNKAQLFQAEVNLRTRHKNYFHVFNLTSFDLQKLGTNVQCSNFKWREIPFSLTEAIKIIAKIDDYQSKNLANTAIIAVSDHNCYEFGLFIVHAYAMLLGKQGLALSQKQYQQVEFMKLYRSVRCKNPPIKRIQSLSFADPSICFIPIPKVFTEGRHNNFQQIYTNNPQSQLTKFYIEKDQPLKQGYGKKYWEKRPATKYFDKSVLVFGDVKIQVFSYDSLNLQLQFVCGFNTKALEYDQTLIKLKKNDIYLLSDDKRISQTQQILIEVSDYCESCKDEANCSDCLEIIKKVIPRYNESQSDIQRLNHKRGPNEGTKIFN